MVYEAFATLRCGVDGGIKLNAGAEIVAVTSFLTEDERRILGPYEGRVGLSTVLSDLGNRLKPHPSRPIRSGGNVDLFI
jgi:hypothetical protein